MKMIAGLVLAGAVAGVAAVSLPGRGNTLPAEKPPKRKEHAENQKYKFVPIVAARNPHKGTFYSWRYGYAGILDGPGMGAETRPAPCPDAVGEAEGARAGSLRSKDHVRPPISTV